MWLRHRTTSVSWQVQVCDSLFSQTLIRSSRPPLCAGLPAFLRWLSESSCMWLLCSESWWNVWHNHTFPPFINYVNTISEMSVGLLKVVIMSHQSQTSPVWFLSQRTLRAMMVKPRLEKMRRRGIQRVCTAFPCWLTTRPLLHYLFCLFIGSS